MPKFILTAYSDGHKYDFNFYTTHQFEDGSVQEDTRKIESDDLADFLWKLKKYLSTLRHTESPLDKAEAERRLREKIARLRSEDQADGIIGEVGQCADYFVIEGGGDGTWGNNCFINQYGDLRPEITRYAQAYIDSRMLGE